MEGNRKATRIGRDSRESVAQKPGGHPREPLHGDSRETTRISEWATCKVLERLRPEKGSWERAASV